MSALQQYNQVQLRMWSIARSTRASAALRVQQTARLQLYYDHKRLSPSGMVDEVLEAEGREIEAQFALKHQALLALAQQAFDSKVAALADIGRVFGARAKADNRGEDPQRFRRWWLRANKYRESNLDGIFFHQGYDPDGPMFRAFCKASGLKPVPLK